MNEGSFPNGSGNTTPFSLAEIWQFPAAMNSGGGGGLGLRRPQFGHALGQFGDFTTGPNREVNGPVRPDLSVAVSSRKKRDSEDDSAKGLSTSNGGANVVVFIFLFLKNYMILNKVIKIKYVNI